MRLKAAAVVVAMIATLVIVTPTVGASTPLCDGQPATIHVEEAGLTTMGTDGDDVIVGSLGDDIIDAGAGNDIICGHSGDDVLIGGRGNDHIQGGNDDDDVRGGPGNDVLFGGKQDDVVRGGPGQDILLGEQGNDTLIGDIETETLWPGPGDNEIVQEGTAPPQDDGPPQDDAPPQDEGPAAAVPLDSVEFGPIAAGTYIAELNNTIEIELPQDAILPFVGPDLVALTLDGLPMFSSFAIFESTEVVINTEGDTAPLPDDFGAFLEADERLVIGDTGTLAVPGGQARWWDLSSVDGAGFPNVEGGCPFGDCVPILTNTSATGSQIVIGNQFDFRLYELLSPNSDVFAIAQADPNVTDVVVEFTESVLPGVTVVGGDQGPPAGDDSPPASDDSPRAGDDGQSPGDAVFDADAPIVTDRVAPLAPGAAQFTEAGVPFSIEFPQGWEVLENRPSFIALSTDDFDGEPVNDILVIRANALSNPEEAGFFVEEQENPFDVRDIEGWLATLPEGVISAEPVATTFGGRDALAFETMITDPSICAEGPLCYAFAGNAGATYTFEVGVLTTVFVVDMDGLDPLVVLISDNGELENFTERALAVANTIAFGEPGANPLPLADAQWEIGGTGETPPGPVEWPLLGGIAVDIPEASFAGRAGANLYTLTNGLQPFPGEVEIFTPVADGFGNPITTPTEFIAAGDLVGFTSTELGTVETRLGAATVIDIEGEVRQQGGPGEISNADRGILTSPDEQLGWLAPPFARIWLIETDRGLVAFTAELFIGDRENIEPLIEFAEGILPSLRFVDEPDGELPQFASDPEVGFDVNPAGDYILELASNPLLIQTTEDALILPVGPELMAVESPTLAGTPGQPAGIAFLVVDEVVTTTEGDTAPVPQDLGAFFEADGRVVVQDSGTQLISGVEARWWDLGATPGSGRPAGPECDFSDCVPIFVNGTVGEIVVANDYNFRVFEIPDPDGTAYAIAQGPDESFAAVLEFVDRVMGGLEVLPAPVVVEFDEGELFGFEFGETLEPGEYFTNEAFSVPVTFSTDQPWRYAFGFESLIAFEDPDRSITEGFQAIPIIEVSGGFADPASIGGPEVPVVSTEGIPGDLIAWADAIPQLEVLDSGTQQIDGVDAPFVDLAMTGAADQGGDCGGTACLILFEFGVDIFAILEGQPIRLYVVDLENTTFLIAPEAPEDEFSQWVDDVQPLIDGISFG